MSLYAISMRVQERVGEVKVQRIMIRRNYLKKRVGWANWKPELQYVRVIGMEETFL